MNHHAIYDGTDDDPTAHMTLTGLLVAFAVGLIVLVLL